MAYLGGERCSPSLRDAFGACSPFLWNRVAHMGRVGTEGHRIHAFREAKPNSRLAAGPKGEPRRGESNTKNPRHFRDGGLLYLGA